MPQNNRRPFFAGGVTNDLGLGGAFRWTQGIDFFCNCANNAYDSLQAKFNKLFSDGYSVKANYTLQRQVQESGDYFFYDVEMNKGPADWDRTHNFVLSVVAEVAGRARPTVHDGHLAGRWTRSSAGGSSTRTTSCRAGSRSASTTGTRARTATREGTTGRT